MKVGPMYFRQNALTRAEIGQQVDFYDESHIERGATVTDIHIHISDDGDTRVSYELINGGQRYKVRERDLVFPEVELTFKELVKQGYISRDAILDVMDIKINEWHESDESETRELHEYLGLTEYEFSVYIEDEQFFVDMLLST